MNDDDQFPSRREILATGAFAATELVLAVGAFAQQDLAPTPSYHDGDETTIPETEGPFFKPKSLRRGDLRESGIPRCPVELSGVVLTSACRPVAGAMVDIWRANERRRLPQQGGPPRGHVFTALAPRGAVARGPKFSAVLVPWRRAIRQHWRAHRGRRRGLDVPCETGTHRVEVPRTTRPHFLDGVSPWRTPPVVLLPRLLRRSILWAPRCIALRRR